jgi:hypothetical protein
MSLQQYRAFRIVSTTNMLCLHSEDPMEVVTAHILRKIVPHGIFSVEKLFSDLVRCRNLQTFHARRAQSSLAFAVTHPTHFAVT